MDARKQDLKWRSNKPLNKSGLDIGLLSVSKTKEPEEEKGPKKKLKKIGSLWERCDTNGATFFSGTLGEKGDQDSILIFGNKTKSKDTSPDYTVYQIEGDE
jgi:hypothetical protein